MVIIINGRYVKQMREQLGISQSELARRVGITQAHVAKIENEKVDARLSTVNKILAVLEMNKQEKQIKCKDIMTKNVIYINPDNRVDKAIQLMRKFNVSQVPLLEDHVPVGSIKESTILENLDKDLPKRLAREVMEKPFPVIDSEDTIDVAKSLLNFHQAILISEKGKIAGIITKSDLMKLVK